MSPQLPIVKRPRALSAQLSPEQTRKGGMNDAAAAAALHRAIQSSPARLTGAQHTPAIAADLTPKPTRRLLFPSPKQSNTAKVAHTFSSSVTANGRGTVSTVPQLSSDKEDEQADKENCPPMETMEETLNDLFEEEPQSLARPTTPIPSGQSPDHTFRTPRNASGLHRVPPKTGDFFSSTAKALLHHPNTPKRALARSDAQPLGEVTPFTAHLNQLFSDAPSAHFDFPTLPPLQNTPGRFDNGYDFSQFDSQDFISTDVPMPSSPPAWFGVYEDPIDDSGGLFSDYALPELQSTPPNIDTSNPKVL